MAEQGLFFNEEHYPEEYKIVDLPTIEIPTFQTLHAFNAKIYRLDGEWKRICFGKIKVIKDDYFVVAAFENFSLHNRLKEKPISHPQHFNLSLSDEFLHNWVYTNQNGNQISIALSPDDFYTFAQVWNQIKQQNTSIQLFTWIQQISLDLFL